MIAESLKWRSEYQPHKIPFDDVKEVLVRIFFLKSLVFSPTCQTKCSLIFVFHRKKSLGTLYQNGKDREGRPLLFIKPGTYNPHPVRSFSNSLFMENHFELSFIPLGPETQIETKVKAMMFTLEGAINQMDKSKGVEKMIWFALCCFFLSLNYAGLPLVTQVPRLYRLCLESAKP